MIATLFGERLSFYTRKSASDILVSQVLHFKIHTLSSQPSMAFGYTVNYVYLEQCFMLLLERSVFAIEKFEQCQTGQKIDTIICTD